MSDVAMMGKTHEAALAAMLDAGNPALAAEIGRMARTGDLLPDEPDEDDGPVNEDAANRVRAWVLALAARGIRRPHARRDARHARPVM